MTTKHTPKYVVLSINWEEKYSTGHRKIYKTVEVARKRVAVLKHQSPNSEHAVHCIGGTGHE